MFLPQAVIHNKPQNKRGGSLTITERCDERGHRVSHAFRIIHSGRSQVTECVFSSEEKILPNMRNGNSEIILRRRSKKELFHARILSLRQMMKDLRQMSADNRSFIKLSRFCNLAS